MWRQGAHLLTVGISLIFLGILEEAGTSGRTGRKCARVLRARLRQGLYPFMALCGDVPTHPPSMLLPVHGDVVQAAAEALDRDDGLAAKQAERHETRKRPNVPRAYQFPSKTLFSLAPAVGIEPTTN